MQATRFLEWQWWWLPSWAIEAASSAVATVWAQQNKVTKGKRGPYQLVLSDQIGAIIYSMNNIRWIKLSLGAVLVKIYMVNIFLIRRNWNLAKHFPGKNNQPYGTIVILKTVYHTVINNLQMRGLFIIWSTTLVGGLLGIGNHYYSLFLGGGGGGEGGLKVIVWDGNK